MKSKKMIFGTIIFLLVITGLISTSIALEDPDYSETILAGHAFVIIQNFNEGETVRIEYEISGGDKDLHSYIRNSTGDIVRDRGYTVGYGIYYFYVMYDDTFRIIFNNEYTVISSRGLEVNVDVVKTLTITSPTNTNTFLSGYNYITWTSTGDIDYVKIDLHKDGGYIETISIQTNNDGSYSWYIYDDEYTDGSYYEIKISDSFDATIYDYSDYFAIECEIKTITITSPISTNIFSAGYNYITWTSTGSIDYVKIGLYKDGGFLEMISGYVSNDGSYEWYIYTDYYVDGSYYQIRISNYYDNTIDDYSSYFTMKVEQEIEKTITISSPASTSTFNSGYNTITWTSTGDIDYIIIELYKNYQYQGLIDSYENNDGSYSWYIYDDEYINVGLSSYFQIRISDYYDDSIYDYSDYFTIEVEQEVIPDDNSYISDEDKQVIINILPMIIGIVLLIGSVIGIIVYIVYRGKKHPKEVITKLEEKPIAKKIEIPKIIYCRECGAKVNKEKIFCSKCGTKIK